MSDRTQLKAVQETLKKIRNRERFGKIIIVIGSLFLATGLILGSNISIVICMGLWIFGAIDLYRYH
jgi:hypothetical protein